MVTHGTAMKIRANRATLHRLPPAGVAWEWCDVVDRSGDGDGVDPKGAHAVRSFLVKRNDGRYETTEELEEYLREKYSIELEGEVSSLQQSTLPGLSDDRGEPETETRTATTSSSLPTTTRFVQVDLEGEDAEDDVDEVRAQERIETRSEMRADAAKHEKAGRDTRQAELHTFNTKRRLRVGRFSRRAGDTYPETHVCVDT